MEKQADGTLGNFVHRRVSQIKILTRLLAHELDAAKGEEIIMERELLTNVLDALEIYVDDFQSVRGGKGRDRDRGRKQSDEKPVVTRLN